MTLAATLSLADAARRCWDVIVVGAGPAGAMSAHALAARQLRVLLVDRTAFPRFKVCGSCLNGRALAALRSCGLGALPDRLGAEPLGEACLQAAGRQARLPLPAGLAVSRAVFDAALVRAAIDAGADFLPETSASLSGLEEQCRLVRLSQRHAACEATARIVIAADGLGCGLLNATRRHAHRDSRIGVGALLPRRGDYAPGTVYLACGAGGYVGVVCVEDGQLDVAAALDAPWLRSMGSIGAAVHYLFEQAALPLPDQLLNADWRGTRPLTQRAARVADSRLFVVGDAAGYVEPFTGEGIAWSLEGALALAPLAQHAVRDWRPELGLRWSALHRNLVGRRQRLCRALAWLLRRPRLTSALLGLLSQWPGLALPVVRHLNCPAPRALLQ